MCIATEDLVAVKRELGDFAQWKQLGLNLGLSPSRLEVIEEDYTHVNERLDAVLLQWLKRNYKQGKSEFSSWSRLAEGVEPINRALAITIRKGTDCTCT